MVTQTINLSGMHLLELVMLKHRMRILPEFAPGLEGRNAELALRWRVGTNSGE